MSEQTLLQDVCERLQADGLTVTVEYPGCVVVWAEDLIAHPDRHWWFGTANATWMGDLCDRYGVYLDTTLTTDVASDCTDAARIAQAIQTVLAQPGAAAWRELSDERLRDVVGRAHSVISTSDGADEHGELLRDLSDLLRDLNTQRQRRT